ncbi:MAG: site-specific integrase [Anaerolineales bacterium]|nr:site-specific integrase [Anaerolineales bacterium]
MSQDTVSPHISPQNLLLPTLNAWRIYLNDQGNSPHTVKAFIADLNLLASYLPPDRTLGNISTTDINLFLDWLQHGRGVPCSPKSLSRRITSIKSFFKWLHQNGVILIDPSEKVVQHSVISPLPDVLTSKEIDEVLAAAEYYRRKSKPDLRPYLLFSLLLHTGLKKGETLSVTHNHIDLESPQGPILFVRYASPQHRYKERKIPLHPEWVEAYQEYKNQSSSDQLFPWSQRRLEYLLEDLGKHAGLSKHLSFDMCRWTCALVDWKAGVEKDKIRQKLGLSKVQWREISMKLNKLAEMNP